MAKEGIDIDLSLEDYFTINEMARKKEITMDEMIEEILVEYMEKYPLPPAKGVAMILRQSEAAEMVRELGDQLVEHNITFAIISDEDFDNMINDRTRES